jgi:sec-independent protein translocase protein TatC
MAKRPRAGGNPDKRMSLAEHLVELKKRLTIAAVAIVLGAIGGFFLAGPVIKLLIQPIQDVADDRNIQLAYTTLTEQFDLRFQIAVALSILLTSPIWLYQVLAFLVPGLTKRERKYTLGFFFSAVPMFLGGGFVGLLIFPHMVALLTGFSTDALAVTNLSARPYYDFVIKLVLACGVAFVLPVFLVLLNFLGVLSAKTILKGWRVAILLITLFCATATPAADLVSMFVLAIPMVVLYFAAVGVALWHDRGAAKREAALEAELA